MDQPSAMTSQQSAGSEKRAHPHAPTLGTEILHQILLLCLRDPSPLPGDPSRATINLALEATHHTPAQLFKAMPSASVGYAIKNNRLHLLRYLWRNGISPNDAHKLKYPAKLEHPFILASRTGSVKLLDFVHDAALRDCAKYFWDRAGDAACASGRVDVLQWWRDKTDRKEARFAVTREAILDATTKGHFDVVMWCFQHENPRECKIVAFPQLYIVARTAAEAGHVAILDWAMRLAWQSPSTHAVARGVVNPSIKSACLHGHLAVLDYFAECASAQVAADSQVPNFPFILSAAATLLIMQGKRTDVLDWFVARGLPLVFDPNRWEGQVAMDPERVLGKWFLANTHLPPRLRDIASGTPHKGVNSGTTILLEPQNPSTTIRMQITNPTIKVCGPNGCHFAQPSRDGTLELAKDAGCLGSLNYKTADVVTPAELVSGAKVRHMLGAAETQFSAVVIEPHLAKMPKPDWTSGNAGAECRARVLWADNMIKGEKEWEVAGGPFVAPAKLLVRGGYTIEPAEREEQLQLGSIPDDTLVQFNIKVSLPGLAFMPAFSEQVRQELLDQQFSSELLAYLREEYNGFKIPPPCKPDVSEWRRFLGVEQEPVEGKKSET